MDKICSICEEKKAQFVIKDTSDYYCKDCAVEFFGDLKLLSRVENEAISIKKMIEGRVKLDDFDDDSSDILQSEFSVDDVDVEYKENVF